MIIKIKSTFTFIVLILAGSGLMISCSSSDKEKSPESERTVQSENPQIGPDLESMPDSAIAIQIEPDAEALRDVSQGDEISITHVNTDESYTLIVRRTENTMGLFSIAADINTREFGFATLTIDDENIIRGTMEFFEENTVYAIIYSEETDEYYLQELEEDIQQGSEPLVDPNN